MQLITEDEMNNLNAAAEKAKKVRELEQKPPASPKVQ